MARMPLRYDSPAGTSRAGSRPARCAAKNRSRKAGEAAGGLAGTALVRHLGRLRPGVLLLAVCLPLIPLLALLALPYGPWWVAGLLFAAMLGVPSVRVLLDVLIFRQTPAAERGDRKSTRLNSSHGSISYAVFCLKKKKKSQRLQKPHRKRKSSKR